MYFCSKLTCDFGINIKAFTWLDKRLHWYCTSFKDALKTASFYMSSPTGRISSVFMVFDIQQHTYETNLPPYDKAVVSNHH